MKHFGHMAIFAVLGAVVLGQFTACTLIGLEMGFKKPNTPEKLLEAPINDVKELKKGTNMEVGLKDGTIHTGKLTGLEELPSEDYFNNLKKVLHSYPELANYSWRDEEFRVNTETARNAPCHFLGFEGRRWLFRTINSSAEVSVDPLSLQSIVDSEGKALPL